MKCTVVTFERSMDITVYVPDDMPYSQVKDLAERLASTGLHDWEPGPWEALTSPLREVDPKKAREAILDDCELMVISDNRDDIVNSVDAIWWNSDGASSNR